VLYTKYLARFATIAALLVMGSVVFAGNCFAHVTSEAHVNRSVIHQRTADDCSGGYDGSDDNDPFALSRMPTYSEAFGWTCS
jgi:hypothetical protein